MLGQSTSLKAMGMCAIIVCGFFVGVDQEGDSGDLSYIGVFYGVMASLCVALNSIYIKKVLPVVNNDSWSLMAYNNANAVLLFLPVMVFFNEVPVIMASDEIASTSYWTLMTIAGIFGAQLVCACVSVCVCVSVCLSVCLSACLPVCVLLFTPPFFSDNVLCLYLTPAFLVVAAASI